MEKQKIHVKDALPELGKIVLGTLQHYQTKDLIDKRIFLGSNSDWFISETEPLSFDYDVLFWQKI